MSLTLYYHPLASYCHKVLIALYEYDLPFERTIVDLGNPQSRAAFSALWPMAKMPVLTDDARNAIVPESSPIIDYLTLYYTGKAPLIPGDAEAARRVRLADRIYDCYVHDPMQKIVGDRLRPEGKADSHGVAQARARMQSAYAMLEQSMAHRRWASGDAFSLADCGASPALFYADKVEPFRDKFPNLTSYFDRLLQRPSYARVLKEAEPYLDMFPG